MKHQKQKNSSAKQVFGRVLQNVVAILLLFVSNSISIAQEKETTALSGSVVDEQGEPIPGVTIAVQSVVIKNNVAVPMSTPAAAQLETGDEIYGLSLPKARTDSEGHFTLTEIRSGPVQLLVLPVEPLTEKQLNGSTLTPRFKPTPNFEPPLEILSVKVGMMTFHQRQTLTGLGKVTFAIKQGFHVKNIKVKARYRTRLHGRIVFADETPFANEHVQVKVMKELPNGAILPSPAQWELRTDAKGYFVKYGDGPGVYTVSVHYKDKRVMPTQFQLTEGQKHHEGPILKFSSKSFPTPAKLPVIEPPPDATTVWVVNPENGHAYKRIGCKSVQDALNQAASENAYLVAINNEAEQKWIAELFGNHLVWVGLRGKGKASELQWDNGEPLTYTNWTPYATFHHPLHGRKNVFVVADLSDGKWYAIQPNHSLWRKTHMAILEKDY